MILTLLVLNEVLISFHVLDHARLKEHVASMEGGLEAKIYEGGKLIRGSLVFASFGFASFGFGCCCHLHQSFGFLHPRVRVHNSAHSTQVSPSHNARSCLANVFILPASDATQDFSA